MKNLYPLLIILLYTPTLNGMCVSQGGQNDRNSKLRDILESYGQTAMLDLVPRRLESHFLFGDSYERDPFLWAFVRTSEDFGHEKIFEAIKQAWFYKESNGVLELDLSDEKYIVSRELRDNVVSNLKEQIYNQLLQCPESIILLRKVDKQKGEGIAIPVIDYLHDVSRKTTDYLNFVQGSKAIYILEIVVLETKEELLGLLQEDAKGLERHTLGYIKYSQVIHEAIMKEYFGQWSATGTRLWVTWVMPLSQATKLRLYREKVRPLKQNLQNKGYFITFDARLEQLHCNNLSPPKKGITEMMKFLTEKEVSDVLQTCPEGAFNLKWEVEGTTLACHEI